MCRSFNVVPVKLLHSDRYGDLCWRVKSARFGHELVTELRHSRLVAHDGNDTALLDTESSRRHPYRYMYMYVHVDTYIAHGSINPT